MTTICDLQTFRQMAGRDVRHRPEADVCELGATARVGALGSMRSPGPGTAEGRQRHVHLSRARGRRKRRIGGTGPNKQRAVEDFIACAQELAKRGFSTPQRTAGFGGSAGGILTGRAYTTAPSAWGAMVVQAGLLNTARLLAMKTGTLQIQEMGDPRTPEGMRQLLAMDPYLHVVDGTGYPPLLLIVGLVDQRVSPWNSGKFGARVAAASPTTPVWYRTDAELGHFATSLNAIALEWADVYAFLDAQLKTP